MLKLVATINGKQVFSDKAMRGINNTRISFADGSWCDVKTGEVVNKGSGTINIGSPGGEVSAEEVSETDLYTAQRVQVNGLGANLKVLTHQSMGIEVTKEGSKTSIDQIKIRQEGDALIIEGGEEAGGSISTGSINISQIGGSGHGNIVCSGNGNIQVGSGDDDHLPTVTVKVPYQTSLEINEVVGTVKVGDTFGDLVLQLSGQQRAKIGKVKNCSLQLQGQIRASVEEVNGVLAVNVMGQAEAKVEAGRAHLFSAQVMGQGGVRFSGVATNATLSVMGQGSIKVAQVINKPQQSRMGQGTIKIEKIGA